MAVPSKRAFLQTFATGVWTQILTIATGALTARLLGPEGRGQFAGAQVWPGIIAMAAFCGVNFSLAIHVAKAKERIGPFERTSLLLSGPQSLLAVAVGWVAMPFLLPSDNPELLWLSRVYLFYVPIFVVTSYLMAIDQGAGDFGRFNIARNILGPVYLILLIVLWLSGFREVIWYLAALLMANFAVVAYRLSVVRWRSLGGESADTGLLFREGFPFWVTGIISVFRENAARLLLMFLLGPVSLGLFVVASTASTAHLNVSKSLNLVIFSRSAALHGQHALQDAARFFRLMGIVNFILSLAMVAAMPLLIWIIYGNDFSASVVPAMLLLAAQYFFSQGAVLDEALRGQGRPYVGLSGTLVGIAIFAATGWFLATHHGLPGVALAYIFGQFSYCLWMALAFRRGGENLLLVPSRADVSELMRIAMDSKRAILNRFAGKSSS